MRILISIVLAAGLLMVATPNVEANLSEIGPFAGDNFENFNSFQGGAGGHATLDIFDGDVTLVKGDGGSVKIEFSSSLGGDLVVPRSPPVFAGQLAPMEWIFHAPVTRFGGYWENNSRFDDAEVEFFDADDNLIGTATANVPMDGQEWVWNGWQSATPIHRILTTGNDVEFLGGFIWFEDMEITYAVPEPVSASVMWLFVLAFVFSSRVRMRQ